MIEIARHDNPGLEFRTGDMLQLDDPPSAYSGIVAFYSIIHVPRPSLPAAFAEFRRVLTDAGVLLLSFHIGNETRHLDEWWSQQVSLDFHFFEVSDVTAALSDAGFVTAAVIEREPIADVEVETRRAYLLCRTT